MDSNQRSQGNNQTDNGANEQAVSSSRGGVIDRNNLNDSRQSGTLNGDTQAQGGTRSGQQGGMMGQSGSQPGLDHTTQGGVAAGVPGDPNGNRQSGEQRSGMLGQASGTQSGMRNDSQSTPQTDSLLGQQTGGRQSVDRTGSQTGAGQGAPALPTGHESNDVAGGLPRSPGGANRQSADEKMDDDTGFSNKANRQSPQPDESWKQEQQSNVGRRSDGTPD
ncbi:MAG: hypothetical protein ABIT83_20740 [Massilia sp.]